VADIVGIQASSMKQIEHQPRKREHLLNRFNCLWMKKRFFGDRDKMKILLENAMLENQPGRIKKVPATFRIFTV
jgi:hypothetical protein